MQFPQPNTRPGRALSTALAAALACAVLLPLLGHKLLTEWDEGIYAEVSREMLGGNWLVPHWNGHVWMEKPPLMLWITAIFFKVFGVSEFWARAGSALSGVALVALVHGWLARRRDLLTAWISTVMLLATFGFLHVCNVGEMDVLLSLGAWIGLIGLVQVDEGRATGWYWFWLGFAIALMTKGAASVVIPLTAMVYAIAQRWRWPRYGLAFLLGLALFAALVLPWHVAMYLRFGHEFAAQYLGFHVLTRAAHQIEGHRTHWWFYLEVLLVSAPPFCLLYPVAIWRGFKQAELRVWAIFAVVVVGFFTMIQTRLPHYVAPAYPALALLSAVVVADFIRQRIRTSGRERVGSPELARTRTPGLAWGFSPTNHAPGKEGALAPGLVALATAAIWIVSILATHSTLKSLHSAQLGDGTTRLDNKEADALLKSATLPAAGGPLLLWLDGAVQSIATVVFYARRPVQQIGIPDTPRDIYRSNAESFAESVGAEPRLLLLDKTLLARLPHDLVFTPSRSSEHMQLGTIVRNHETPCPIHRVFASRDEWAVAPTIEERCGMA